jgi:hypothetical protein
VPASSYPMSPQCDRSLTNMRWQPCLKSPRRPHRSGTWHHVAVQ